MTANRPRSIGQMLQSGEVSAILAEVEERRGLRARVRAELPPAEAEHVVSAHIDDAGRLVIGVDSAAWAARLRYTVSSLLGREARVRVARPGAAD